jgi:pyruvate,water dikinase
MALWRDDIGPHAIGAFARALAGATDLPDRVERELRALVGAEDASALLSNLSGLSSPLESLGPMTGIARVARGEMTREAFLDAYGHRGVNEGEYAWPRPMEDPAWLDRQLAEFARAPVEIDALLDRQRAAFSSAWDRFAERHPRKVKAVRRRLQNAARAASQRERVRSEATRCETVIRAFALRAGELTGLHHDVFFLTIQEVLAALAGDDSARARLPLRKETYARYASLPPYPSIIIGRFDPFQWAADPTRRGDVYSAQAPAALRSPDGANTIRGFAGALGIVEGTVRRLDRLEDSPMLLPGEILVTTLTNIGWTPLFPRLAAIVTDLGAPLSHAAIVARELGIPAVVGCHDATMRLKTGDRVRVNGGRGLVEILESSRLPRE